MSTSCTTQSLKARAQSLQLPTKLFIDGEAVDAASGKTFECINPGTGEVIAHIGEGDVEDINLAVAAARRAFESGVWSNLPPN